MCYWSHSSHFFLQSHLLIYILIISHPCRIISRSSTCSCSSIVFIWYIRCIQVITLLLYRFILLFGSICMLFQEIARTLCICWLFERKWDWHVDPQYWQYCGSTWNLRYIILKWPVAIGSKLLQNRHSYPRLLHLKRVPSVKIPVPSTCHGIWLTNHR